jgi:serine/threonine-protein kinase OSR1/STK39
MDQETEKKYPALSSDYKLYEEVGQGVSANVYRALCIPFNEIVAVKVLDLEKCNSNLDGVRREAQIMSLIDHPNVLKACCSFIVDHTLWVVMPYMSGGSCLHIMKSAYPDGFEEQIIATFLREVLKALEYLHNHGHIHRDVKAGNILVDASGAVKLADFGVSACMFDSGDRQRSRNTFVGTPCWMAPEVMEQLHGYDFKADIWSFGITALELAHGHAPFSKYPPMKVLLMTLQNAPPGLDYERDKKFSKSFKEMVAMCLVKDPTKRPTSAKLLKHHFFKHARSNEYVARTVLDGLPPLGERCKILKLREMDRVAQNKMAYEEKEEISQSEYIRGISAWNFNLEDLKAQAALIQDDDQITSTKEQPGNVKPTKGSKELSRKASQNDSPVTLSSLKVESSEKDGDYVMPVQPGPLLSSLSLQSGNGLREQFDVIEDDNPIWQECINSQHSRLDDTENARDKRPLSDKELGVIEDAYRGPIHGRKVLSGPLGSEHVITSSRGGTGDGDRERHERRPQHRNYSGPLMHGSKDIDSYSEPSKLLEDKLKVAFVQQKGRFKVTSEDVDLNETLSQATSMTRPSFAPWNNAATVSASAILPDLQSILEQNIMQRDQIIFLMKHVSQGEIPPARRLTELNSKSTSSSAAENFVSEVPSDRELWILQQTAEMERRVESLVDELQRVKMTNIQLERQLNAAFNREEEERIKIEEAAREQG